MRVVFNILIMAMAVLVAATLSLGLDVFYSALDFIFPE